MMSKKIDFRKHKTHSTTKRNSENVKILIGQSGRETSATFKFFEQIKTSTASTAAAVLIKNNCNIMASSPTDCEVKAGVTESLYSKMVKGRLLEVFQKMTDKITPANFNEIFKHFDEAGAVVTNVDQNVQTFKDNLYRNISDNFKDMWHFQEIDLQLNSLNFCKEKCKNNTRSWRPTGKTAEEQTKYLRIHYLKRKIAFIEIALEAQTQGFESTCQEAEAKRAVIENIMARRDAVSEQMDIRMAQINKGDDASQRLQRDLCG